MRNELQIIDERELLGKEFKMYGDFENPLFLAQDVAEWIEHSKTSMMLEGVDEDEKLKETIFTSGQNREVWFLTEDGLYEVLMQSRKPIAKQFKKEVKAILKEYRKHGKYDSIEQQIMLIEDEKERTLTMELYKLNELLKINPNDMFNILQVKNKEQELALYKQSLQLEDIKNEVKDIKQVTEGIKKATVLREGDSNAYVVADRFGIYSTNNKAHNQFASKMAKILGIYVNPEGNGGYQDEYVSVNLTNFGGKTTATLMYSEKAIDKMREYIEENGLLLKPVYYIKGDKKGQFKEAILYLDGEDSYIKVNETTYNKYLDK